MKITRTPKELAKLVTTHNNLIEALNRMDEKLEHCDLTYEEYKEQARDYQLVSSFIYKINRLKGKI